MKTVCLLSGGLDSATLLHHLHAAGEELVALSFRYPSRHNARELSCAAKQASTLGVTHRVIALDGVFEAFRSTLLASSAEDVPDGHYEDESMRSTVVPFRNGIFLSVAVGLTESLGCDTVAYGCHAGDNAVYPDCRPEFVYAMKGAVERGSYRRVTIDTPFIKWRKRDVVATAVRLGVPLHETWTCYRGGDRHCGRCGSCQERILAFAEVGVIDPVKMEVAT